MIYHIIKDAIYVATENEENYDRNGNINWDLVDIEVYSAVGKFCEDDETFYWFFNDIVDCIIYEWDAEKRSFQYEMMHALTVYGYGQDRIDSV